MIVNKRILAIGLLLTLAITVVAPATAQETPSSKTATVNVTIPEVINFSITDYGDEGIDFGDLNPGDSRKPELTQNGTTGALTLKIGSDTNVPCVVGVAGSGDFTDGSAGVIALSNATWHTENDPDYATQMSTTYATVVTTVAGTEYNQPIRHWIDVPLSATAGAYATTFYYRAVKQ